MTRKDIPNAISVFRITLVIPVVWLLIQREFSYALLVFFIAGLSDAVDGYLAKRNHWESRLGSILDPLADKVMLVSAFVTLTWLQLMPLWLLITIFTRDVIIVAGGWIYHYAVGEYDLKPTLISKLNTVLQIFLVLVIVFSNGVITLDLVLIQWLIYWVLVTTVVSGIHYVSVWGTRAYKAIKNQ